MMIVDEFLFISVVGGPLNSLENLTIHHTQVKLNN